MGLLDLNTYTNNRKIVAVIAILISITAWLVELMGAVYVCPYCRVQRTVIGILGIILILPFVYHWMVKYIAIVIGLFGAVVAANQHFMGWKKISAGTFEFNNNVLIDPFLLSGCAMFLITGLVLLIINLEININPPLNH
ncbi:hypothetical protein [Pseudoalteromonas aurantia]|uniref:Disulfide bond formation protein B n=1 Tax=Pseudoalteromonas aurantia 208 TaxID=1314867 RepID=A0ABR9EJD8_9GAMM|nr:hypothetical protein [Pseudoalteromonas aurantia]MBE0371112.1 hypothetical protein [Pseudoalteromonas aurantia 208]